MNRSLKGSLVAFLVMIGASSTFAEAAYSNGSDRTLTAGLTAGTLGAGLNISVPANESFSIRANANGFNYSDSMDLDDVTYSGDLNLKNVGLLVDYYPYENAFRLIGGVYYNGNNFDGTAVSTSTQAIAIGDDTYTADEIGSLSTHFEFDEIAPYAGIGWGSDRSAKGWGYTLDLGVLYQGSPKVTLDAELNPLIVGTAVETEIRNNIVKESQQILTDIEEYEFYPVLMAGIHYKF